MFEGLFKKELKKRGNSVGVFIPLTILQSLKWGDGTYVSITVEEKETDKEKYIVLKKV